MSILVNKDSRVLVQGITGIEGTFHTAQMMGYGTIVTGGVTPGKGGTIHLGLPVFNTVKEAREQTGANVSIIFVPPQAAGDAIMESAAAGIELIVAITEGIPVSDMVRAKEYIRPFGCRLIGPNCPGVITPGEAKVGIMPGFIHKKGHVGLISRSGTLAYEAIDQISRMGIGQSTSLGIGGDPVIGTSILDAVKLMMDDDDTHAIVIIGEIGGTMENDAAEWIRDNGNKPVAAFIAGQTAPKGRRMGHAGAIIGGKADTAAAKTSFMKECGIHVIESPADIGETVAGIVI